MNLSKKIDFKKIPQKPGVYFFKDKDQKVLYVGKAISLRTRIKQYLQKPSLGPKIRAMLATASKLSFVEVGSDVQAVILEAKLIKQYRPKYNVSLKDGKRHLYLGISKEEYPKIGLFRRPELETLLFWAGPFPSSGTLKQILRWVRKIFPYCSCKAGRKRPCLYYQIGLCPGPGIVGPEAYRKNINSIILFFSGKSETLLKKLNKRMKTLAKELKFEQAAEVKKQIFYLEQLIFSQRRLKGTSLQIEQGLAGLKKILIKFQKIDPFCLARIEGYDIANLGSKIIVGSMVVLENGEPSSGQYRRFKIMKLGQDDPAALAEMVTRRLNHQEWIYPQLVLIDGGRPQLQAVIPVLETKGLFKEIGLFGLVKGEEKIIIPRVGKNGKVGYKTLSLAKNSPALKLLQVLRDESHRFAQRYLHQKQRLIF
ncbi:GIY-YIG nuclease family protein [Patescibacteria group bacterium]|nr:GIY-YIG nuclease family protein [Patescibacteria group bacterium]